ncbi:MAG: hypothetical protein GX572_05835, partial [Clostridia bacterium]|nr:hypothetical protein [Clostridia bacterium]
EMIAEHNLTRILEAFRAERVSTQCFCATTGYGYNDMGRDKLEQLYARIFATESALLRQQIVSGSHAIALAVAGNLLPGDELLLLGRPYDTLQTVIGMNHPAPGSLSESGVRWRVHEPDFAAPDIAALTADLRPETKMVLIQRSRGYSSRRSLPVALIGELSAAIKAARPDIIVFTDNCYGEMVEEQEPSELGVDLLAGSLIKNLGAGIAPGGGYIAGKAEYVERAAVRLTIPGAGKELGASLIDNRLFYQSLLLAPQIVLEAVLGAVFIAALMQGLGFAVDPAPFERRADIVQTIAMGNAQRLQAFVRGIQKYSPVDSFVTPEPWPMPGYDHDIIMASGSFIAGSSIELSADAPLREPYLAFIQGGLSRYHVIDAVTLTVADMRADGLF